MPSNPDESDRYLILLARRMALKLLHLMSAFISITDLGFTTAGLVFGMAKIRILEYLLDLQDLEKPAQATDQAPDSDDTGDNPDPDPEDSQDTEDDSDGSDGEDDGGHGGQGMSIQSDSGFPSVRGHEEALDTSEPVGLDVSKPTNSLTNGEPVMVRSCEVTWRLMKRKQAFMERRLELKL